MSLRRAPRSVEYYNKQSVLEHVESGRDLKIEVNTCGRNSESGVPLRAWIQMLIIPNYRALARGNCVERPITTGSNK